MSDKDKILISDLMESFVSEVPANPFVTFCAFCTKGVIKEDMVYEKGLVFHRDCFSQHGNDFPTVNHDLISQNTNAKIQLIQLKNLKARILGSTNSEDPISNTKTKLKSHTKKRWSRRILRKRRTKSKKFKKTQTRKSLKKKIMTRKLSRRRFLVARKRHARRRKHTIGHAKRRLTKRI
jgi:hypothetical protein